MKRVGGKMPSKKGKEFNGMKMPNNSYREVTDLEVMGRVGVSRGVM
jgi:hypothetical protein